MSAPLTGSLFLLITLLATTLLAPELEARAFRASAAQEAVAAEALVYSLAHEWLDTPEERWVARMAIEKGHHELAKSTLPAQWESAERKSCLIVHNSDKRALDYLESAGKKVYGFLEDHFGFIGEGEYVRRPVFRVFADSDEESALKLYSLTVRRPEVRIAGDELNYTSKVTGPLLTHWFRDRDADLHASMPAWMKVGLAELLASSRLSGKRMSFTIDHDNLFALRAALKAGNTLTTRELIQFDAPDEYEKAKQSLSSYGLIQLHARIVMEYLLVGKGSTNKAHKGLIAEYLENLQVSLARSTRELNATAREAEPQVPKTVEDEENILQKRRYQILEVASMHVEYAFECTFRDWTEKDWERLRKAIDKEI